MRMTLADRRSRQRRKKARDLRNGIVHRVATKNQVNKTPVGRTTTASQATAKMARNSAALSAPSPALALVNSPLAVDLALPVTELGTFTRPVLAALTRAGLTTVGAAKAYTEEAFSRIEGVGPKTVDKIRDGLRGLGLGFAETSAPALAA
jgi:hypothetical protein